MIKRTLLVTSMAAVLSGCGEGSVSSAANGFAGFTAPSTETVAAVEPEAGAAQAVSSAASATFTPSATTATPEVETEQPAAPEVTNVAEPSPVLVSPYVESIATNSEALVNVPDSESSTISTQASFLFDTSKTVHLKVNLTDTVGTQGSLSVCTDYQETETGFSVDYKSCPIRGTLENGQFDQDMSLMNQFDSVIAVIWFRNQEFAPRYQVFTTSDLTDSQEWIWN